MAQEARGLDAGPRLVQRLQGLGDPESAALVAQIAREEVAHVAVGDSLSLAVVLATDAMAYVMPCKGAAHVAAGVFVPHVLPVEARCDAVAWVQLCSGVAACGAMPAGMDCQLGCTCVLRPLCYACPLCTLVVRQAMSAMS